MSTIEYVNDWKATPQSHFHAPTQTLFELATCGYCNGALCTDRVSTPKLPNGVKVWGDSHLPPLPIEGGACTRCKGEPFYIEKIKSEYAIVSRAGGELAGSKKSEKAAALLCAQLNAQALADSLPADEHVAGTDALTTSTDTSKLGPMVVIRLAGDLGNGMKRGDHLSLPIAALLTLINETGTTIMAKTAERKTAKDLIRALIIKGKTDAEVLDAVHKDFPESAADKKHCTKYRRELFVEEKIEAKFAAVGSTEHREWALANPALAKKGPHGEYWKEHAEKAAAAPAKAPAKPAAKAAAKPLPKPATKAAAKPAAKAAVKPAAKAPAKKPATKSAKAPADKLAL